MKTIQLTVNGRLVSGSVEPRMHLADFLREHLNLTATHLRCEQGACGACTILIDGQPARSCITYAAMLDGAAITTIEGLQDDAIMGRLRRAFSEEHGLQCGYCTPGMLVTARDILIRLPDADQARIRGELSGNLCRCTGYVGIVRAISRALDERRANGHTQATLQESQLGPVGARRAKPASDRAVVMLASAPSVKSESSGGGSVLGLNGREPNVVIQQSFTVSRPPEAVWEFFANIASVVPCVPGASLTRPPAGDHVEGKMSVKLGPMTANFAGEARIVRDNARQCGIIMAAGKDQFGGTRAAGEVEYALEPTGADTTRVMLTIRALLVGPLAQFRRSSIVEDLVARITAAFARNLEVRLSGAAAADDQGAPLEAGSLIWQVIMARLKALFAKTFGSQKP